ncbi:hypothetical protein GCM10009039_03820 [Halocalculus aciditolerans]|uniref:Uncharacterized protein n=1 Tax=Halocalculus aciditolerans TaxID=1383812 RepID=A0A830F2G8_9EURY|nr:hypothetical protein GCM10009039_03820 [Halocalculus aciditolerans]
MQSSNEGWRDGVICEVCLDEAVVNVRGDNIVVTDPTDSVYKIVLERFYEDDTARIEFRSRTDYHGRILSGRTDARTAILPFIVRDSDLGNLMREGSSGVFTFSIAVDDNKRTYRTSVDVRTSLKNSAGGELDNSV